MAAKGDWCVMLGATHGENASETSACEVAGEPRIPARCATPPPAKRGLLDDGDGVNIERIPALARQHTRLVWAVIRLLNGWPWRLSVIAQPGKFRTSAGHH